MLNTSSAGKLGEVCPALTAKIYDLVEALDAEGVEIQITQGLRSWNEQAALWAKGRDSEGKVINPGEVVTKAPPGHSWRSARFLFRARPSPAQLE